MDNSKKPARVIGGMFTMGEGSVFKYVGRDPAYGTDNESAYPNINDFPFGDTNPRTTEKSRPTTGPVGPVECVMVYRRQNDKDETIAEIDIQLRHGSYWVTNVWTTAEYRGRGYASSLMNQIIKDMGYTELRLFVFATGSRDLDDGQLKRWYGSFGFKEVNEAPGVMIREPAFK